MVKVIGIIGFIILGIIINCGGVPTDTRGYIGAKYWHEPGAFRNGFKGFCSVFVSAAFSFGGTELVGLAAAEAENPQRTIPKATKQVFWRILLFYVLSIFIVGLIVPSDSDVLLGAYGSNTKASPFVLAMTMANISVLPSIFNAVITIAVISSANACTFGSSRTLQALAANGMAPKFLSYVDEKGRPVWCILLQLSLGLLAFINEAVVGATIFSWLLALAGLSDFVIWGTICFAHIRFRRAWKLQGHSLSELPYKATLGVFGSWVGLTICILCLIATFYVALFVSPSALSF
jgi:amino acid transporter